MVAVVFGTMIVRAEPTEETVYFSSEQELVTENDVVDTRDVPGMTVTLKGVNGQDRVSFDYLNYIAKDELTSGFLELAFLPETVGQADFDYALITLTDADDENQKLVYAVAPQPDTAAWWYSWSAAWIGYTDNVEPVSSVKFQFNSMLKISGTEQYLMGYNNSFIAPTHIYYTGPYMEVGYNLGAKNQYFVQDTEDAALGSLTFALSGTSATINGNTIADLTNDDFMQSANAMLTDTPYENLYSREYFENLFSSGYCKLKITLLGCRSDNITCHIRKIGSQWIESNPGKGVVNASPQFNIDHNTHAVAGKTFVLPDTTVRDFREGDISGKAEYAFFTATGDKLSYSGDSIVFPQAGEYEMRCFVQMESGETFSASRSVICYEKMPKTSFTINGDFAETYKTGDVLTVPPVSATNDLSTKNDKSVSVSVYLQLNGAEEESFSATEYSYYTLTKAGNYVLSFLFQNEYGIVDSRNFAFTVENSVGFQPGFLPVTLTSEKANRIADCELVNYVNDTPVSEMYRAAYVNDTRVFLAKGDEVIDGSFTFNGKLEGVSAVLTYKAGFSENEMIYETSYTIPVIAPVYAEDYIVQYDGADYTRIAGTQSSVEEIIFTTDKDMGFMLPQILPADGLEFSFDVKAGGEYSRINVVLRDYENPNKKLVFSLSENDSATSVLSVNGVYEGIVNGSLINDSSYFQWRFNGTGNSMSDQSGNSLTKRITSWEDGTAFSGFGGGLCVLSFELEGVESTTGFALKKVNNQPFFTTEIDGVKQRFDDVYAPNIFILEEADYDNLTLGETAVVSAAAAYDVLSPVTNISVTITKPDGTVVLDQGSCETAIPVSLDMLGRWTVEYNADGGNGLFSTQQRITFNIKDTTAPKIHVNGDVPSDAKTGEETTFPSAFVFDNVTQNCAYYIIIVEPDGMRRVAEDGKFTFTETGKHIVQYYAYDDAMNVARVSYEIFIS